MKISNNLGIIAPSRVRRKQGAIRRPPWYVEVPPDTVDIALLPRINRYERGGLRFRQLGSTQQKFADRMALFRDAMGEIEPGVGFTTDEMRHGLEDVMRERLRLIEEAESRSEQLYGKLVDASSEPQEHDLEALDALPYDESLTDQEDQDEIPIEVVQLNRKKNYFDENDAPLRGAPTEWLTRKLMEMDQA